MGVRALVLGGARSGKSALAEGLAKSLGGDDVLYVATAEASQDADMERRIQEHRRRRPTGWTTLELGGGDLTEVLRAAAGRRAVLFDSLTLWVSARMSGEDKETTLEEFGGFVGEVESLETAFVLVSDEIGFGVVPESVAGRRFRDLLGLVNQQAAAAAAEVHLCVAGIAVRIK